MKFLLVSWLIPLFAAWHLGPAAAQPASQAGAESPKAKAAKSQSKSQAKAQKQGAAKRHVKRQRGKASWYGGKFAGKKMADGTPMNPRANTAASKTLPLGTKAEVKNLETGKSAVVEIRDRGPYVDGRIIDVTPKVAEDLDMKKEGVAPVEVVPIEVPPPRGAPADGG